LRGDDAAGLLTAKEVTRLLSARTTRDPQIAVFVGDTVPENLTGEIKRFRPTHLVIVDAANFGQTPGHVRLLPPETFGVNASFSTHGLSLKVLADYLRTFIACEVLTIGIQPATLDAMQPPSAPVRNAARDVAAAILAACAPEADGSAPQS
jgi:hydrogenase 3 maturation protease